MYYLCINPKSKTYKHQRYMTKRNIFSALALLLCLLAAGTASAQSVIFPQETQPGTARVTSAAKGSTLTLRNTILSASFTNKGGKVLFGGCPQLGAGLLRRS